VRGNFIEQHAGLVVLHRVLVLGLRPHHASIGVPLPPSSGAHRARPASRELWRTRHACCCQKAPRRTATGARRRSAQHAAAVRSKGST
jgi:hypothetical protein